MPRYTPSPATSARIATNPPGRPTASRCNAGSSREAATATGRGMAAKSRFLSTRSIRLHELVFRMADGQHGARRLADNLLCHAAQEHVSQPAAAVRAHYDEIDVLLLGHGDDLVKRRAGANLGVNVEPLQMRILNEPVERLAGRVEKLLDGRDDGRADGDGLRPG